MKTAHVGVSVSAIGLSLLFILARGEREPVAESLLLQVKASSGDSLLLDDSLNDGALVDSEAPHCTTPRVTNSSGDELVTRVEQLTVGIKAWEDRSYTVVGRVPAEMSGALFLRLKSLYTSSLQFSGLDVGSVVFICSEDSDRNRGCGYQSSLIDAGFTRLPDGLERTGSRRVFPMACYKKDVLAESFVMPVVTTPKCHQFVAVKCAAAEEPVSDVKFSYEKFASGLCGPS